MASASTNAGSKAENAPDLHYSADPELDARERAKAVAASKGHNVGKQMSAKISKEHLIREGVVAVKSGEQKYLVTPKVLTRAYNRLSMTPTERKALASEVVNNTSGRALSEFEDLEPIARSRMKPMVVAKGHGISKQMPEKKSKESLVRQGVAAVKKMEQKSLMPPRILSRACSHPLSMGPTEQKTFDYEGAKCTTGMTSSGNIGKKKLEIPKKPISGDPTIARSTPSPRSSSSGSPHSTMSPHSFSCASFERSGSTSSDSIVNTPQRTLKYKPESRKLNLPPTDSVNPRLNTLRNKLDFKNGRLLASHIPTSRFSPSSSPASSFDSSSSSSSSASTNQRPHNSISAPDITVQSSLPGFEISEKGSLSHGIEKSHTRNDGFCQPASAGASLSCSTNKSGVHSFKPSGLRMPSPKIGFFDSASIPPERNPPTLHTHSRVPSTLPRNPLGIGNSGGAAKLNSSKLQSIRHVVQTGYTKLSSNSTGLPYCNSPAASIRATSPALHQQLPSSVPTVKIAENRPGTALKAHKDLSVSIGGKLQMGKSQQGAVGVTGTAKFAVSSGLGEEECSNQIILKSNTGTERQEEDTGNNLDSACFVEFSGRKDSIANVPNMEICHQVSQFEDHGDDLGVLVDTMHLNTNAVIEITEHGFSLPHSTERSVCDQKIDFVQGFPNPFSLTVSPTKVESRSSGKSALGICKISALPEPKTETVREKAMNKSCVFPFAEKDTNLLASVASTSAIEIGQENVISKNTSSVHELRKENDFENCCNSSPVSQSLAFLH